MTIGEIIKDLRIKKNMTQEELAKAISASKQTIYKYEKGIVTNIPYDSVVALAKTLDTTPAYLMGWESPQINGVDISKFDNIKPIRKKKFPLLGEIACGEPIFADRDFDTFIEGEEDINADFCLICKGDSMIGDGIQDGDIVFIRQQDAVDNGDIACIIVDDDATLKHFYMSENIVNLVSSNSSYAPLTFTASDAKTLKILGKAVAFLRRI